MKIHYIPKNHTKPLCNQKVGDFYKGHEYLHMSDCKKCQIKALKDFPDAVDLGPDFRSIY